jgi:DNA (cytosine-5)-methyltransferase 1
MEEVPDAPVPHVGGYDTWECIVRDKWVGGVQPRPRRFSFGTSDGRALDIPWVALMRPETDMTLVAGHGLTPGQRDSVLADGRRTPVKIGGSGRVKRSVVADARVASSGARVRSKEKGGGALPGMGSVLPIEDACEAMGVPRNFTEYMPFTMHGKRSVLGNGVPMAMGRAVARAVRRATL